jgi:glycerol-1-phosphate dehydrogenase [NAD(P)+]
MSSRSTPETTGARTIHDIELPLRVVIGVNALNSMPEILRMLGLQSGKVAVMTGPNVFKLYGEVIEAVLRRGGYEPLFYIVSDASLATAEKLVGEVLIDKPAAVVGFGGGKSIDVAKYVSGKVGVHMISVPTSPSHDGIASPFVSLKGMDRPYSMKAVTPRAIVADIKIVAEAPLRLIRAGAGDIVGKLTAVRDWELAHRIKGEYYGEYAARLARLSAKHVIENASSIGKGSPEGVRILVEALVSSGVAMCIAGSTRPASGSEHLFSHALDIVAPGKALHGEQVALGTIMMMYLHGGNWRRVKRALRELGLPTRASELGLSEDEILRALLLAPKLRPERYTILGESGLTENAARELIRRTGIV